VDVAIAIAVAVVVVVVAVVAAVSARSRGGRGEAGEEPISLEGGARATVILEIDRGDPESAAVRRLVHETAARVFRMMPSLEEVEVRSRTGSLLGTGRREPLPEHPVAIPQQLHEPHRLRTRVPHLGADMIDEEPLPAPTLEGLIPAAPTSPTPAPTPEVALPPPAPIADRFDLPESVRRALRDPDDPVDVVRAILDAAGIECRVEGELIYAADQAVVVLKPSGAVVGPELLNHAYLRIQRSEADRGLVIAFGRLDLGDIRRRELLAPSVLHVGVDGIQRMADAVAIGADPWRFAAAPPLARPNVRSPSRAGARGSSSGPGPPARGAGGRQGTSVEVERP
jgi:hypothetical protein